MPASYYKEWRKENRDKFLKGNRRCSIKRRYGISEEEYDLLRSEQNGKCKICIRSVNRLVLDHCHKTNKIRGFLCQNCNTALGMLQDNIKIFQNAIKYLERNK